MSFIRYGTSPSDLNEVSEALTQIPLTVHRYFLSGLRPDTVYTYQVCETAAKCSAERYTFRTKSRPVNWPALPESPKQIADPKLFSVSPLPVIDGKTFQVAADCLDLAEKIREAAGSDGDKNHQVLIPPGADCTAPSAKTSGDANGPTLILPAKNGENPQGTGEIIIRSSAPDEALPPEGIRTGSSFLSKMPTIRNGEFGVRELYGPANFGNICTPGQWWWHYNQPGWSLKQCSDAAAGTYTLVPRQDFTGTPPTNCKASSWYYKSDVPVNVNGIYWCTAESKLYNMSLGRLAAFHFADKAHHYRFFGIQFSVVPMGVHEWRSKAVYADGSLYQGQFEIPASAHHITFDRCFFTGLDAPERLFNVFYSGGSYIAWLNNHIEKVSHWLPSGEAGDIEASGIQITGGNYLKIINNYIESTGITVFASDDAEHGTSDVEMTGNLIHRPERYRFGTEANKLAGGMFYQARHSLELKRGVRWLIDGNRFAGNFATVNQGHVIALSPRPGNKPDPGAEIALTDIAITNNRFEDTPNGIYLIGHHDVANAQMPIVSRIDIFNNLMINIDGAIVAKGTPGRYGHCVTMLLGLEDISFRHNVCYDNKGYWPAFLWEQYGPSSGLNYRDNVVTLKIGDFYGGLVSPGASRGTKSLEKGFPNAYQFVNNAIINVGGDNLKDYPPGNFWVRSVWDMGWVDPVNGNFRLKPESLFRAGQTSVVNEYGSGTDNTDMGVRFKLFDRAQRALTNVNIQTNQRAASLRFSVASRETSCAVDVSTDLAFGAPMRFWDGPVVADDRTIQITQLRPATRYYWRLLCGAQAQGVFTTPSGGGGL